jgi:hypothetical protein
VANRLSAVAQIAVAAIALQITRLSQKMLEAISKTKMQLMTIL